MSRNFHFEIKESKEELLLQMKGETNVRKRERLQFLYWYKSGLAITREQIAGLLGRSLSVVTKWMRRYMEGGLKKLLNMDYRGRKASRKIPVDAVEELTIKLEQKEGFGSYQEIQEWIKKEYGIEAAYSTVHKLVKYDLNASPKVVRPFSEKQNPAMVENFKENLSKPLIEIVKPCLEKYKKIRYWVQDESRLSLKTWLRRRITKCGIKPVVKTKANHAGYSLYGAVEIKTGESFFMEGDRMNQEGFEKFLKEFSEKNPSDFHVVQLDNASFHTTKKLLLPDNVMLLYQPPYSPEVNPIEQVWGWLKGKMAGKIFSSLDELKSNAREILLAKDNQFFKSIIHRSFILDALDKVGI